MNLSVAKIREIAGCFWRSRILLTAVELKLFDVFDDFLSSEEVAKRLKINERAIEILLHALAAIGVLEKKGEKFGLTEVAAIFLRTDSEEYPGGGLRHMAHLWKDWSKLTSIIKSGCPIKRRKRINRDFILGMEHLAKEVAEKVANLIDLSEARLMLDLGAGSGAYSVAFLKRYPKLNAVLFDLPGPINVAKELIKKKKIEKKRIKFIKGDFLKDDLGNNYDFVWMSSIIHIFGEKENKFLLKKVYQSLNNKGKIGIRDFLLDESGLNPPWAAIFSVNMLIHTQKGRSYKEKEVIYWVKELGFDSIKTIPLDERSKIILAIKP